MRPFDLMKVEESEFADFLGRRFLREMRELGHAELLVVPIVVGEGMAVATVGIPAEARSQNLWADLINALCQFSIATIHKNPEILNIFEPKRLTRAEAEVLLLATRGYSDLDISRSRHCSEHVVAALLDHACKTLGAVNRAHLVALALASGEISNTQIGPHDFV